MNTAVQIKIIRKKLYLKHPFKLSHGTYRYRENVFFVFSFQGISGMGEAPVVPYYGYTPEMIVRDLQTISRKMLISLIEKGLSGDTDWDIPLKTMPARFAVETALLGFLSSRTNRSMAALLGIPERPVPPVSFTVTGNSIEELTAGIEESSPDIIKLKAGVGDDIENIVKIRERFPEIVIRMDVNGGWSLKEAVKKVQLLRNLDIQLLEEPITGTLDDIQAAAEESPVPVFLDESVQGEEDVYRVAEKAPSVQGIVVKLAKSGGPFAALSLIRTAGEAGLDVMLSSMVESSLGIYTAAALAPLCRYADLDSPFLLVSDPFNLVSYRGNSLEMSGAPLSEVSAEFFENS